MNKNYLIAGIGALAIIGGAIWYMNRKPKVQNAITVTQSTSQTSATQTSASAVTPAGSTVSQSQPTYQITTANYPNQNAVTIVTTTTPTSSNSSEVSSVAVTGSYIVITPTTISRSPNTGQALTIEGYNFKPNDKGYIFNGNANMGGIELSGYTADSNGHFEITLYNTESNTAVSSLWNAIQNNGNTLQITAYSYGEGAYSNTVTVSLV